MVNMPPPMEAVFTLYKSFANEKMKQRMNAHPKGQSHDALVNSLGKDVLPAEYGGSNGTLQDHIGKPISSLRLTSLNTLCHDRLYPQDLPRQRRVVLRRVQVQGRREKAARQSEDVRDDFRHGGLLPQAQCRLSCFSIPV